MADGQFSAEERSGRRQWSRLSCIRWDREGIEILGAAGITTAAACSHKSRTQIAPTIETILLLTHSKIQQVFRATNNIM